MKLFIARASSDWGGIFYDEQIKASDIKVAAAKAATLARQRSRKFPKELSIHVKFVSQV